MGKVSKAKEKRKKKPGGGRGENKVPKKKTEIFVFPNFCLFFTQGKEKNYFCKCELQL